MITLLEFYKHPHLCQQYYGNVTDDTIDVLEELEELRETVTALTNQIDKAVVALSYAHDKDVVFSDDMHAAVTRAMGILNDES